MTAGQPTKYKKEYVEQVYKLCLLGATDKEIADFFVVCEDTIHNWKHAHLEFFESIKKGKDIFDTVMVETALKNRAIGYEHKETKTASHEGVFTDTKDIIKHYPPDTTAAIFWLKNRQPERWRDKTEVESTNVNLNAELDDEKRKEALGRVQKGMKELDDYK